MIGLYLMGLIAVWLLLTWFLLRFGWRIRARKKSVALNAVMVCIVLIWFGLSFWYGGGRKFYYDWQVEQMCAANGGIKVYEVVELPEERFDQYGVIRIPSKNNMKPEDKYYYETDIHYFRKSPEVWRLHFRVYKSTNNKLLGEAISYARRGGDLPGPWQESSFGCPEQSDVSDLKRKVFSIMDLGA